MSGRLNVGFLPWLLVGVAGGLVSCPSHDDGALTGVVRGSLSYQARLPTVQGGALHLDRVDTLPAAGLLALVCLVSVLKIGL